MSLNGKFIQENTYEILSESPGFCGKYDKNILCAISVYSVDKSS